MRYRVDNSGNLKKLSNVIINPSSEEIDNFDDGIMWYEDNDGFLYNYFKINNINILLDKVLLPYLIFSSDSSFTLSVSDPRWNGIIEYSSDKSNTWNIWNGSQLSGDENNPIYLRGIGNTVVSSGKPWTFTGKYITGNIETLLDCQTVANSQHPTMGNSCYEYMFNGCTSLTTPPELPATTLASVCYGSMFYGCTSLTTPPKLPATTLTFGCYNYMFQGCTSLTTLSELPATILDYGCYNNMFRGCTSLKISTTQDPDIYKYPYRIPKSGTGTTADVALTNMFASTGGTFKGTPTINTTYYTDHQPV